VARRVVPANFPHGACFLVQEWLGDMVRLKHLDAARLQLAEFQRAWLALLLQNYLMPITDFNSSNVGVHDGHLVRFDLTLAPSFEEAHARRRARGVATAQRLNAGLLQAARAALPTCDVAQTVATVLGALAPRAGDSGVAAQVRADVAQFARATDLAQSPTRARVEELLQRAARYPAVTGA
jgi:hypothetical protein